MGAHEERERRALEGELAGLEQEWRDAAEIAAISDDLLLPGGVQTRFDRFRGLLKGGGGQATRRILGLARGRGPG